MSSIQLCVYVCMAKSTHSACTLVYVYTWSVASFVGIVWEHFINSVVYVWKHGQEYTFCVHSHLCVYMFNFLIHGYSMGTIHEFSCVCFCAWPKVHILRALSFMCLHEWEHTFNYNIQSTLHDAKHTFSVVLNLQGAKVELYLAPLASCLTEGHKFKIGQWPETSS